MKTGFSFCVIIWISLFPAILLAQSSLHSYEDILMGTRFQIKIYGDQAYCDSIAILAFQEVERINSIFSNYIPDSELSKINKSKSAVYISNDFYRLYSIADSLRASYGNKLDPTIGQAIDYWKIVFKSGSDPNWKLINKWAKKRRKVKLKETKKGFKIKKSRFVKFDMGALAKGYAVDWASELIEASGIQIYLVNGGGDLRLGESIPGEKGWKIQINDQKDPETKILKNCSIASSGDQYQFSYIQGIRYSHIIDPKSLIPLKNQHTATVITDKCVMADALATVYSFPVQIEELRKPKDYQLLLSREGEIIYSDLDQTKPEIIH